MERQQTATALRPWMPAMIAVLVLAGVGWIAPAPARAQDGIVFWEAPSFDLGGCEVGTSYTTYFYVGNTAKVPIYARVAGTNGPFFGYKGSEGLLSPGQWVAWPVTFQPTTPGQASGALEVDSSYLPSAVEILPLKGTGVNGPDIPDLSGTWSNTSGIQFDISHSVDATIGGRAHVSGVFRGSGFALVGQFDGQVCFGWVYESTSLQTILGGFGFAVDANDPDSMHLVIGDAQGKTSTAGYLFRQSPFSGYWDIGGGKLVLYRISAQYAQSLRQSGAFSPWDNAPTTGVSWYYGKYTSNGGGEMLGYTFNTWDVSKPPSILYGLFRDYGAAAYGWFNVSLDKPGYFQGQYGYGHDPSYNWSGTYIGPIQH
jgi:hypothetical protein